MHTVVYMVYILPKTELKARVKTEHIFHKTFCVFFSLPNTFTTTV